MGLIAATAFILATQTSPAKAPVKAKGPQASQARLNEIWDHIDNRFVDQSDVWFDDGEFPSCVAILKVQAAFSPDDYEMATNLGWMLENIERHDEAMAVYLDFGTRHPENGNAMYALGFGYYQKKDYANAIRVLEPTLARNVGPNTYRTLARSYEMMQKPLEAIRVWELELKKFPGELAALANIKRVKAKLASGGQ
jgi:tetratricopeptide (TPR) repeat protein